VVCRKVRGPGSATGTPKERRTMKRIIYANTPT
jgi:hypothetical protein